MRTMCISSAAIGPKEGVAYAGSHRLGDWRKAVSESVPLEVVNVVGVAERSPIPLMRKVSVSDHSLNVAHDVQRLNAWADSERACERLAERLTDDVVIAHHERMTADRADRAELNELTDEALPYTAADWISPPPNLTATARDRVRSVRYGADVSDHATTAHVMGQFLAYHRPTDDGRSVRLGVVAPMTVTKFSHEPLRLWFSEAQTVWTLPTHKDIGQKAKVLTGARVLEVPANLSADQLQERLAPKRSGAVRQSASRERKRAADIRSVMRELADFTPADWKRIATITGKGRPSLRVEIARWLTANIDPSSGIGADDLASLFERERKRKALTVIG
jgi:hypothetical protein